MTTWAMVWPWPCKASVYQLQWCDDESCTNTHTMGTFMLQSNGAVGESAWLLIAPFYASGKFANK
ncbi:hypothetical protein ACFL07_02185 [Pseudomonadota bacterium]